MKHDFSREKTLHPELGAVHTLLKMAAAPNNIEEILKPFYQRASEAEDRLAKLDASVARNNESGNDEHVKLVGELQSLLERAKAEQLAERETAAKEVQRLATENAKLEYRIVHLVRAVEEVRTAK